MFLLFGEEGRRTRRDSRFVGAETSKNACIFICEATPDASAEHQRGALSLLAHQTVYKIVFNYSAIYKCLLNPLQFGLVNIIQYFFEFIKAAL